MDITIPPKDNSYLAGSNAKTYLLLFLFWPFLAFVLAIINYSQQTARKVIYIFLIYYGFSFVNENMYVDAFRYAKRFIMTAELPFSDFFVIVGGLYTDSSVDIIEPLSRFIISRFTDNPQFFFAFWVAFMGFFYLKSINLLYSKYQENPNTTSLVLLLFFIFTVPITAVSGIRMPTAMWIFFYAAYHVVLYRDKRYLLLALSASLVHWSFLTANAVLLLYFFAGNRNWLYLPLTVVSFIVPNLLAPLFKNLAQSVGGAIQDRYKGYSNEDYIEGIQQSYEGASWFMGLFENLALYFLLFSIIYIQLKDRKIMQESYEKNLYSFLLLFLAFINFGQIIPSFGGRFQILFYLLATTYVFLYSVKIKNQPLHIIKLIGIFPILLFCAIQFRMGSESINAWIFYPGFGLSALVRELSLAELMFN
ncbi:EpsG family protein [Carboxylicivirga caseinilyticus]|uniref:EpsG family protein n=1 Tax=Carboxylicivirga caseinilyticus TaxID=3417572 RepID=UPI003D34E18C